MPDMRFPPPARLRKVGRHAEPCPRTALAAAAEAEGHSLASLSRMIFRRDGYLACFVREGHPVALNPRDHKLLSDFFGVEERGLGIRGLWDPLA